MKSIQDTIDYLEKLSGTTDICYACFDNPMCEDCFLNSAIHHLKMFQKVIAIPEGESGEITVTVRKKSHRQTYKQFLEDMKVLGYDEISRKENDR